MKRGLSITNRSVAVIGGGIAGCTTAIELADREYNVILFEEQAVLLSQSSDITPCRIGVGMHYRDAPSAKHSLDNAVYLVRHLIKKTGLGFRVGESFPPSHRLRHVFYVLSKESLINETDFLMLCEILEKHYALLVNADKKNKVFGEVSEFYRIIDKQDALYQEISGLLQMDNVSKVVMVCEHLFDWPALKTYLLEALYSRKNIQVLTGTKVKSIDLGCDGNFFVASDVTVGRGFDLLVNAAWHNVDLINSSFMRTKSSKTSPDKSVTNRVKCMAIVNLPEQFRETSIFVCYGPFTSLSARGDGKGYITYEPVTNMGQFSSSDDSQYTELIKYITSSDLIGLEEKEALGKAILEGASIYLKGITASKFEGLRFGIVRTDGGVVDINDVNSPHHERLFSGVRDLESTPGLIVNEARKHIFWAKNMTMTADLVDLHYNIKYLVYSALAVFNHENLHIIAYTIFCAIRPAFSRATMEKVDKNKVIKDLREQFLFKTRHFKAKDSELELTASPAVLP